MKGENGCSTGMSIVRSMSAGGMRAAGVATGCRPKPGRIRLASPTTRESAATVTAVSPATVPTCLSALGLPTQAMKASARSLTWPSWVTWGLEASGNSSDAGPARSGAVDS
jgi:hypothetical protein